MAELTRRLQILLSQEQFDFLKDLSARRDTSVGDLIRYAVDRTYRPSSSLVKLQVLHELRQNRFVESDSLDTLLEDLGRIRTQEERRER